MNNDTLQSKAINILNGGYMPTDNKNLITFAAITSLFVVSTAAAFVLGYQLSTEATKNNLAAVQEYRHLEAEIINAYEEEHGLVSAVHSSDIVTPYSYINKNGIQTPIHMTPPPEFLA